MNFKKIFDDYFLYEYRFFRISLELKDKKRRLKNEFYEEEKKIDIFYIFSLWYFYIYFFFLDYKKAKYIRKNLILYLKIKFTAKKIYMENQENG